MYFLKILKLAVLSLLGMMVILLIYFSGSDFYLSRYYSLKVKIISFLHGESTQQRQNYNRFKPAGTTSTLKSGNSTDKKKSEYRYGSAYKRASTHKSQSPLTNQVEYNSIDDTQYEFPVDTIDINFLTSAVLEKSFSNTIIGGTNTFTLYRLGTVISDPYEGGILYDIESVFDGKGYILYDLIRCLKVDSQVILLSRCSSTNRDNTFDPRVFITAHFNRFKTTELFHNCTDTSSERLVTDDNVIIKELVIPGTLEIPEFSVNLYLQEVRYIYQKTFDSSMLQLAFTHTQLGNIYTTREELNGRRFSQYTNWLNWNADPDVLLKNGFYVLQQDSALLVYAFDFEEISFNFTSPDDYVGATFRYCNGSYSDYGCVVPKNELDVLHDLIRIGTANLEDPVYSFADTQHSVLKKIYADYRRNCAEYEKLMGDSYYLEYDEFIDLSPIFFWKDGLGRYLRFISTLCLPPLNCEPFIYLYSPVSREFTLTFEKKVKVLKSIPEYSDTWEVKAGDDGEIIDCHTGKKFSYLFWEGVSDFLPPLNTGFVVKQDEIDTFFQKILVQLGLNSQEIKDFLKAWLPEFTSSPFYFIGFYDQEIIDYYAPLSVVPQPKTIIRILMDFRALDKEISVPPQILKKVPKRKGITLVEWGGLKRSVRKVSQTQQ